MIGQHPGKTSLALAYTALVRTHSRSSNWSRKLPTRNCNCRHFFPKNDWMNRQASAAFMLPHPPSMPSPPSKSAPRKRSHQPASQTADQGHRPFCSPKQTAGRERALSHGRQRLSGQFPVACYCQDLRHSRRVSYRTKRSCQFDGSTNRKKTLPSAGPIGNRTRLVNVEFGTLTQFVPNPAPGEFVCACNVQPV